MCINQNYDECFNIFELKSNSISMNQRVKFNNLLRLIVKECAANCSNVCHYENNTPKQAYTQTLKPKISSRWKNNFRNT